MSIKYIKHQHPGLRHLQREVVCPYIGFEGEGSRLAIKKRQGKIIVRMRVSVYLTFILGLGFFGPGLTVMLLNNWEGLVQHPSFIIGIVIFFNIIGWLFCLKFLFEFLFFTPYIEIDIKTGSISLKRGGKGVVRKIYPDEIKAVTQLTTYHRASTSSVENYTIRLIMQEGGVVDLCTSDKKKTIDEMEQLVRRYALS